MGAHRKTLEELFGTLAIRDISLGTMNRFLSLWSPDRALGHPSEFPSLFLDFCKDERLEVCPNPFHFHSTIHVGGQSVSVPEKLIPGLLKILDLLGEIPDSHGRVVFYRLSPPFSDVFDIGAIIYANAVEDSIEIGC